MGAFIRSGHILSEGQVTAMAASTPVGGGGRPTPNHGSKCCQSCRVGTKGPCERPRSDAATSISFLTFVAPRSSSGIFAGGGWGLWEANTVSPGATSLIEAGAPHQARTPKKWGCRMRTFPHAASVPVAETLT